MPEVDDEEPEVVPEGLDNERNHRPTGRKRREGGSFGEQALAGEVTGARLDAGHLKISGQGEGI